MDCENAGVKWQKLPLPVTRWFNVERQGAVISGILSGRIVHHHGDQRRLAVAAQSGDATTLILPREPSRNPPPQAPFRYVAVDVELAADFVKRLVLFDRTIDLKNHQIVLAGVLNIYNRHARPLVLPGE